MTGKVKWFNVKRGYGFISGDDGKDIFVHGSNIVDGRNYVGLEPNDEVEYDEGTCKKGTNAENVVLTKRAKPNYDKPEETE